MPSSTPAPIEVDTELEAQLIGHIRERLHVEIPGPDAELFESGLIDSLAFVELLLILSEKFGVEADMADLDLDNFNTVRHIAVFISERRPPDRVAAR